MIYKALLLMIQRFFWSKIRSGIKSKLILVVVFFCILLVLGAVFSSFYLNMTFKQGLWATWGTMLNLFVGIDQVFSGLWDKWMK